MVARNKCSNFYRLVESYRKHGHKQAAIDPITISDAEAVPELLPSHYGLELNDVVSLKGILSANKNEATVGEALEILNNVYSRHIGAEFCYLEVKLIKKTLF